jgi:hypothetical protein
MKNKFSEVWARTTEAQKIGFWNGLKKLQKKGVWNLFEDFQKKEFWNLLEDSQKKELWNLLEDNQKASLVEILSRNYTLAQVVFAAGKIVEKRLKEEPFKKYNFKSVYLTLVEGTSPGIAGAKKAIIIPKVDKYGRDKTLRLNIVYNSEEGIVEYDDENYISKKCARFLVGHEIGHILLHLENIIENIMENKELSESLEEEERADFFARIISDLRDLYILRHSGDMDVKTILEDNVVANKYKKCMEKKGIVSEDAENMINLALNLNEESKIFTMSSYVFATKDIMSAIHSKDNHKISEIYSRINNCEDENSTVRINRFHPDEKHFGYNIEVPKSKNIETNSNDTANGIGALLLYYDKIKNESEDLIIIDKRVFPMESLKKFSKHLLKEREIYLKKFSKEMKSKSRLIKK